MYNRPKVKILTFLHYKYTGYTEEFQIAGASRSIFHPVAKHFTGYSCFNYVMSKSYQLKKNRTVILQLLKYL